MKLSIETVIEKIDFTELHELRTMTEGFHQPIIIWDDGSLLLLSSNEWPNTDRQFYSLNTTGRGNVETSTYADGWADEEMDEDGDRTGNYITDDGRILTEDEMIIECIHDGDWSEVYEYWKDELRNQDMENNRD